jgi:hypothetical protein
LDNHTRDYLGEFLDRFYQPEMLEALEKLDRHPRVKNWLQKEKEEKARLSQGGLDLSEAREEGRLSEEK